MAKPNTQASKRRKATKPKKGKPLTLSLNEEQLALISRAAEADDDIRANWCRRKLLQLARARLGIAQPVETAGEK